MSAPEPTVSYINHALEMLIERGLEREWVERTIREAKVREPDPKHTDRMRAFHPIVEREGRVLRVVYERVFDQLEPHCRVITAFFDRSRKP